jgi:hypothetical protein
LLRVGSRCKAGDLAIVTACACQSARRPSGVVVAADQYQPGAVPDRELAVGMSPTRLAKKRGGRRGGETAEDDVLRLERAKRGWRRWARGRVVELELRFEALPGRLALPDADDPEALVRRAGNLEDETLGSNRDGGGEALVLLPGGRDVLNEGKRHAERLAKTALGAV